MISALGKLSKVVDDTFYISTRNTDLGFQLEFEIWRYSKANYCRKAPLTMSTSSTSNGYFYKHFVVNTLFLILGVHLKALETYRQVFDILGTERLAQLLYLFAAGLFPLMDHCGIKVYCIYLLFLKCDGVLR